MEDARLYRVGGVVERALEERWGGPLLARLADKEIAR